jgi:lysophospholipase L1-like esterase
MKQILIFGASITHGTGGENGGWADKVKLSLHKDMYGTSNAGESYQVYELGVPGQALSDILDRFMAELHPRMHEKPENICIVLAAGANDSKAVDAADNHLKTPDDFAANVHSFIHLAKDYTTNILCVGIAPVDESKTTPKQNPLNGHESYFSNERIKIFEQALQRTCETEGVYFVSVFDQVPADWQQNYLWQDGLHPNEAGHEWLRSQIEPKLRELTGYGA